nr:SDR family NAD(P)-dependent oxidoreductase [Bifidobacterium bombi]
MGVQRGTFHAAIVTGSAAGLGLELVRQLLERGWFVCGVDFDAERMAQLDREFETSQYQGFVGDVTDEDFVRQSTAATRGNG